VNGSGIGLGCMRLSTESSRDEESARAVLRAALEAGITTWDTAPSYCLGEGDEHHNERLIASVLGATSPALRVSTKGGLVREGTAWVPDGRARSLIASCEASLVALGRSQLDLFFLHAPDPRVSFATSVRALGQLKTRGLVRELGLSNVSLAQLDDACREIEISAIQVAFGAFDDAACRSGLVSRALSLGMEVHAHTPLGSPRRVRRLGRDPALAALASKYETTAASIVLAWFAGLSSSIVLLPGARRVETVRAIARAREIVLDPDDRATLDARFPAAARSVGRVNVSVPRVAGEVVLVMGIQGAGKSRHVQQFLHTGYERLNRDERGGTLKGLAVELDQRLLAGARRVVLDNTYGTRATRSRVLEVAEKHGLAVRCVWLDTPLEVAQVNAVARLIERYGKLPDADELRQLSRQDPNAFLPNAQFRYRREFEPPTLDEGFSEIQRIPFERVTRSEWTREGMCIAADRLPQLADEIASFRGSIFSFAWLDGRTAAPVAPAGVELGVCSHGGGPPTCWCRPPLPGLVIAWMLRERIDPAKSRLYGTGPHHRALARALEMTYVE
jgi:aryl-alcohol dehydrogenase-like predicted oxidoreductase